MKERFVGLLAPVHFREGVWDSKIIADVRTRQGDLPGQLQILLERSYMNYWQPGEEIPGNGRRVLIGIFVFSDYDLQLLDALEEKFSNGGTQGDRVDVFACDYMTSDEWLRPYIPGLGNIHGTPVVGVWHDGNLVQSASGPRYGRHLLKELYDISIEFHFRFAQGHPRL